MHAFDLGLIWLALSSLPAMKSLVPLALVLAAFPLSDAIPGVSDVSVVSSAPNVPSDHADPSLVPTPRVLSARAPDCGKIAPFLEHPLTRANWTEYKVDEWLDNWIRVHEQEIAEQNAGGLAAVFGRFALGDPRFACKAQENSICDFDACGNDRLNQLDDADIGPAFMVLRSLMGLRAWLVGWRKATGSNAVAEASHRSFVENFYRDFDGKRIPEDYRLVAREEVNSTINMIIGIAFAAAATTPGPQASLFPALGSLVSSVVNAVNLETAGVPDSSFNHTVDVGEWMARRVQSAFRDLTKTNDNLMHGELTPAGNIGTFLQGGAFLELDIPDKTVVTKTLVRFLVAKMINWLWLKQRIFIMGGVKCDRPLRDFGPGEPSVKVCLDGQAWYLYYYCEPVYDSGWVGAPPGMNLLGRYGVYANISMHDVVKSSVQAYSREKDSIYQETPEDLVMKALLSGQDPAKQVPGWEGTFTIPVCEISHSQGTWENEGQTMVSYGQLPKWCGNICGNSRIETKHFMDIMELKYYNDPPSSCEHIPPWGAMKL